jgi:hypothetical protein
MPISRHLLMCYNAIFRRTDFEGKYLEQWLAFQRGHFENGLRIQTFQDFYDHFGDVIGLFRQHNFIEEYDSVYRGHPGYIGEHLTTRQCEINLECLRGWIYTEGAHDVEDEISQIVRMYEHSDTLTNIMREIENHITSKLDEYKPRDGFAPVDSYFNTGEPDSPRDDEERHGKENESPAGDSEQDEIESVHQPPPADRDRRPAGGVRAMRAKVALLLDKLKSLSD